MSCCSRETGATWPFALLMLTTSSCVSRAHVALYFVVPDTSSKYMKGLRSPIESFQSEPLRRAEYPSQGDFFNSLMKNLPCWLMIWPGLNFIQASSIGMSRCSSVRTGISMQYFAMKAKNSWSSSGSDHGHLFFRLCKWLPPLAVR